MKKFFTLAAAVLASFSLWAAEPDFESYDWQSQAEAEAVAGDHDGIVISYAGLGTLGNVSGHWYIPNNQNLKNSDDPWKYFGIAANAQIDSVAFLYCPNGSNLTTIAWVAWGQDVTPNQYVLGHGVTTGTKSSKSWDNAIWETIDLTGIEAYTVYMSRSIREFREIGGTSNLSNFGGGQTINILGVRVWLHETKTVVSTVETLTNVKVNGTAISATDLNELVQDRNAQLNEQYTTAPTVTFTKHVVITYDDESTKQSDVDVEVVAEELGSNQWTANITLNGADDYSITMQRAAAYTVTYKMMNETVLGTEVVAAGEHPAEYAQYEVMPLSSFIGWRDEEYEMVDLSQVLVIEDMTFYADFVKAYAQSIDFEGMVIINGKSYDVKSALTANFYDYKNIDALDSLNNSKGAGRNEPYLGLKIKKNGGYLACNVQPGTTLRIKFGYVAETVLAIAGSDTLTLTPTNNKLADLVVPFAIEKLVKLQTTSDKTVVIKQIMIDQPFATWMYPITYAEAEHGTVSGWTIAFPNEEVQVNFTMDEGYTLVSCYANEQAVVSTPQVGEFFTMPAEAVTVSASFGDTATAIDNAEEEVKAVKVIRNGQLFIEKNGVLYDAQGAVVR